jgi:hypothetical protein
MPRSPLPLRPLAATITLALALGACKPSTPPTAANGADAGKATPEQQASVPQQAHARQLRFRHRRHGQERGAGDNFFDYANGNW